MANVENNTCSLEAFPDRIVKGGIVILEARANATDSAFVRWEIDEGKLTEEEPAVEDSYLVAKAHWDTTGLKTGVHRAKATFSKGQDEVVTCEEEIFVWECALEAFPKTIVESGVVVLRAEIEWPVFYRLNVDKAKAAQGGWEDVDDDFYEWRVDAGRVNSKKGEYCSDSEQEQFRFEAHWDTTGLLPGSYKARLIFFNGARFLPRSVKKEIGECRPREVEVCSTSITVISRQLVQADVTLQRTPVEPTTDQALWVAIRNRTGALDFTRYQQFINCVFCKDAASGQPVMTPLAPVGTRLKDFTGADDHGLTIHGPYAYMVLKLATQVFLLLECGVKVRNDKLFKPEEEKIRLGRRVDLDEIQQILEGYLAHPTNGPAALPYLRRILEQLIELDKITEQELPCYEAILKHRLSCPSLLELIWSYWHEEGMLVQTMNAIALRFQNRSRAGGRDPLANLEIDSLRPLNNLLWGFIQDEYNRLTVPRRAYEYDHHYGLTLVGKAVPRLNPADSRSKFIEGFHNLLYRASAFFREDADTTVHSDGFSLLNALKEVHLLLAEGAHNQFGDLPWTARAEMLTMQWLLARPEIGNFLRGRAAVPYREGWMGQVDTMKRLQGWTDTTITHFHNLGRFGEQILLSVRYGDWIDIDDQENAKNWARYWRPEIQGYTHAYQAATGVDLAADAVDARQGAERYLQPSAHLRNRLAGQKDQGRLPAPQTGGAAEVRGYAELIPAFPRRLPRY